MQNLKDIFGKLEKLEFERLRLSLFWSWMGTRLPLNCPEFRQYLPQTCRQRPAAKLVCQFMPADSWVGSHWAEHNSIGTNYSCPSYSLCWLLPAVPSRAISAFWVSSSFRRLICGILAAHWPSCCWWGPDSGERIWAGIAFIPSFSRACLPPPARRPIFATELSLRSSINATFLG